MIVLWHVAVVFLFCLQISNPHFCRVVGVDPAITDSVWNLIFFLNFIFRVILLGIDKGLTAVLIDTYSNRAVPIVVYDPFSQKYDFSKGRWWSLTGHIHLAFYLLLGNNQSYHLRWFNVVVANIHLYRIVYHGFNNFPFRSLTYCNYEFRELLADG